MAIIMLLRWSVLVLIIFVLIRSLFANPPHRYSHSQSAESLEPPELLDRRLARGEIDLPDHRLLTESAVAASASGGSARRR